MKKDFINEMPTKRNIYIWNIFGSLSNALLSVLILMVVTRFLDETDQDIFSIAWSISALMATIGTFQIRTYQATDVQEYFKFGHYFVFRIATVVVMMICSCLYILNRGYSLYKILIIMIFCLYRAFDAISDVFEGWFQQKERLDLAGIALTVRVVLSFIVFSIILFTTNNLLVSSLSILFIYVLCLIFVDYYFAKKNKTLNNEKKWENKEKWFIKLLKEGLPLFINAYLMMSINNASKMSLDKYLSLGIIPEGAQTIFNILFMPASVLTLAYIVFRPLLTSMAIQWNDGNYTKFMKIIFKILIILVGMSLFLLISCYLFGTPILSLLYGINLNSYRNELVVVVLGGCFCTLSYVFDNALVVIRKQYYLVLAYFITWIITMIVADSLVYNYELLGASLTYLIAMGIFFIITGIIFFIEYFLCIKNTSRIKKL